jgi:hypothetical protein
VRRLDSRPVLALMFVAFLTVTPLNAQPVVQKPSPPPPPPRHTGVKAMIKGLFVDFKYVPSQENAFWAGLGGLLAAGVHPADEDVNHAMVNSSGAKAFFKPGAIIGAFPTLVGSATITYIVGRTKDEPKVSHVGMDLLQSLAMSEMIVQVLKFSTGRERPDHSNNQSFPSGHASDTFAFATALERHLNWKYFVPAYIFSSYVAMSRLPSNRHWLSDVVFGSSVGIISGRTVTSHEAHPYPVAISYIPGGVYVAYVHRHRTSSVVAETR